MNELDALLAETLELAQGCIRLARACAIGSDSRKNWLAEARYRYIQYKNCLRLARR
jgi:hypothetical protein